jgi:hypothetical protein
MINIWCYWGQGEENIPEFQKLCIKSWKKNLGQEYKINIISKDYFLSIQNEFNDDYLSKFTFQQQSDIVRLYLLYEYGGIWMDITTILQNDLSFILNKFKQGYEQVGFNVEYPLHSKKNIVLESWFIAVKSKKNFKIGLWKETFIKILNESLKYGSIKKSPTWKKTNKNSIPFFIREYLCIHVAHLWCIQNNKRYNNEFKNKVYLFNANKTALINPNLKLDHYIFGLGYDINFPLIKFTNFETKYVKYLCSNKLKRIIKRETGKDYVYNRNIILIIILIIIYFIYKFLKKNNKKIIN